MDLTASKKYFLLSLPILLFLSTAFVFTSLSQRLGSEWGYLLGFSFYWIVWCLTVPLICLGKDGFLSLFKEETPLFKKENWLSIALLSATIVGAVFTYFIPNVANTPLWVIVFSPITIINGTCEEILWRGLYIKAFPNNAILGYIYPMIGFAVWHISPHLVIPEEGGIFTFLIATFFLGLCYGWVAYETGSIKWTAVSHSLIGLFAFGEPLSTSIVKLVFR